jgi:hypothetical protein
MRSWLLWLWLAAGAALFAYGAITGGGAAGWWLYRDLTRTGSVSPSLVHEVMFLIFCVPPLVALAWRGRRRPYRTRAGPPPLDTYRRLAKYFAIAAAAFSVLAVALWQLAGSNTSPAPADVAKRMTVEDLNSNRDPPEGPLRLIGTARPDLALRYVEMDETKTRSYRHPHSLLPLAEAGWTPQQPVRVLADLGQEAGLPVRAGPLETPPGLLVKHQLPAYVLWALRDKGLMVEHDTPVLVPVRDRPTDIATYILAGSVALAVVCLLMSLVMALAFRTMRRRA